METNIEIEVTEIQPGNFCQDDESDNDLMRKKTKHKVDEDEEEEWNEEKEEKKYECNFCDLKFRKASRLEQHVRIHTGERPYLCLAPGCGRSYTRQQHLKRHIASSHTSNTTDEEKIRCNKCEKEFANKYSLKKHQKTHNEEKCYECQVCGVSFKKQHQLKTHSFEHTGLKPFVCSISDCKKRFENRSHLKRHEQTHRDDRYVCHYEDCLQKFERYCDFRLHFRLCHPKECDVCGKTFDQMRKLRLHRETHKDVRVAYFCPVQNCNSYFYHEKNLTAHIRERHEKASLHICLKCNLQLSSKQKLQQHMKKHMPGYKLTMNFKKFPRKPRKDKGISRTDYAQLLSGYNMKLVNEKDEDIEKSHDEDIEKSHETLCDTNNEMTVESSTNVSIEDESTTGFSSQDQSIEKTAVKSAPILKPLVNKPTCRLLLKLKDKKTTALQTNK